MTRTKKYFTIVILARGGSKGIPNKNIKKFCGKPLLVWSLIVAKNIKNGSDVWVSSDNKKILKIAEKFGVKIIKRPKKLASDKATSVSGYKHAINEIQKNGVKVDAIIALQPTSPIRTSNDIDIAIKKFKNKNYDSIFSASEFSDSFLWEENKNKKIIGINHNYKIRKRRQEINKKYLENGSFYIFKPKLLNKDTIFGGKIGFSLMPFWKSFEIDEIDDWKFCSIIMKEYLLKNKEIE
mgnify:CR=1 FL=1